MARPHWRQSTNTQVAMITKGTVTTTTATHTYIVTITDDNGETAAITYTLTGSEGTTTAVATAFVTAWNASYNPLIAKFTASSSSAEITLTADSAGRSFSIAYSGTGTWSGTGTTTSSVSNTDYSQATNWAFDAVPVNSDDVNIGPGTVSILYGLNQSAVTLDEFLVQSGYTGSIGRIENGILHYLRIACASFRYSGSSTLAAFDLGSSNIPVLIESTGTPSTGLNALYIKGSNLTTLTVISGDVGIASWDNSTATVATVIVGSEGTATDADVTLGSGLTLTTLRAGSGTSRLKCAATTVNVAPLATLETSGSGAITTLNAYGTCYPNSSGTITTVNAYGTVNFTRDRTARTVTNLNLYPGAHVIADPNVITFTDINFPTVPGTAPKLEFK